MAFVTLASMATLLLFGCPSKPGSGGGSGGAQGSVEAYKRVNAFALLEEARDRLKTEVPGAGPFRLAKIDATSLSAEGVLDLHTFDPNRPTLLRYTFSDGKTSYLVTYSPDPRGGPPFLRIEKDSRGFTPFSEKTLLSSESVAEASSKAGLTGIEEGSVLSYAVIDGRPTVSLGTFGGDRHVVMDAVTAEVLLVSKGD